MSHPYCVYVRAFARHAHDPFVCAVLVERAGNRKVLGPFHFDGVRSAHGVTLRALERVLNTLAGRGTNAEVHTNLQSVVGVLRGEHLPAADADVVGRVRALAGGWVTFLFTPNREEHPRMSEVFHAAQSFADVKEVRS